MCVCVCGCARAGVILSDAAFVVHACRTEGDFFFFLSVFAVSLGAFGGAASTTEVNHALSQSPFGEMLSCFVPSVSFIIIFSSLQAVEEALSERGRPPVALEPQPQQARGVDGLG